MNNVHQRLGEASAAGEQFAILCDFARRRLARSRVQLRADAQIAVDMLVDSAGMDRIENICRSIASTGGVSSDAGEDDCSNLAGMTGVTDICGVTSAP